MLNPSNKYGTKTAYTELRKFLIKYSYLLLQPEVFMRVENTKKNCIKHQNRIKEFLPKTCLKAEWLADKNRMRPQNHLETGLWCFQAFGLGSSCGLQRILWNRFPHR